MEDDRCRYTWPRDFDPYEDHIIELAQNCCWRETVSDLDRCALHTNHSNNKHICHEKLKMLSPQNQPKTQKPSIKMLDGANLQELILQNIHNLSNVSLRGADLSGANLENMDISGSDLTNADLSNASLYQANFSRSFLKKADLTDAELNNTNFSDTNLEGADLNNQKIRNIDLDGSNLKFSDFSSSNLRGVDFSNIDTMQDARFSGSDLKKADFSGIEGYFAIFHDAKLSDANLHRAKCKEADLSETNLKYADLSDSYFHFSYFNRSDISYADLTKSSIHNTNFTDAELIQTDLSKTDLSYADFTGANINSANLTGSDLSHVTLNNAAIHDVKIANADISNLNLVDKEANLDGVFNTIAKFTKKFGEADRSNVETTVCDCVIGENKKLVWIPGNKETIFGKSISNFVKNTEYERGQLTIEKNNKKTHKSVFAIHHKEVKEIISVQVVKKLAYTFDVRVHELMEIAKVRQKNNVNFSFVVLNIGQNFDFIHGQVLIFPFNQELNNVEYQSIH